MSEFLSMGGYAVFVWPAFLVSLIVLVGLTVVSLRTYREQKATLAALEAEHKSKAANKEAES